MNLAMTEDQRMIRDAAASFLADASSPEAVRAAVASDRAFDEALWRGLGEMGWCGTAIPESDGGMGLGPQELVLIFEQLGRRLACAPFLGSIGFAASLLVEAGSRDARREYLGPLAQGALRAAASFDTDSLKARKVKGGWQLSGHVPAIADGAAAQLFLLAGTGGVFAVPAGAKGLRVHAPQTWDETRRGAALDLKNVLAQRVDDPARKHGRVRAEALARLYLAAEQLGGAQECLDLTLRYLSERRQFGRAIASFQAVKHRCALMMVKVEGLRSAVYGAAAVAAGKAAPDAVAMECAGARALAGDTFFHCAAEAIQLHGGVGFTWEFEPQLYFKRAQATSHLLGTASTLREQIAQELL